MRVRFYSTFSLLQPAQRNHFATVIRGGVLLVEISQYYMALGSRCSNRGKLISCDLYGAVFRKTLLLCRYRTVNDKPFLVSRWYLGPFEIVPRGVGVMLVGFNLGQV